MSILATSVPITDSSEEFVRVPCIYYLVWFLEGQRHKNQGQKQIRALLDSGSKVNTMNPALTRKLCLQIRKTNVGAQKIDGSTFETFGMVIVDF